MPCGAINFGGAYMPNLHTTFLQGGALSVKAAQFDFHQCGGQDGSLFHVLQLVAVIGALLGRSILCEGLSVTLPVLSSSSCCCWFA